jgi:hypothetical protein
MATSVVRLVLDFGPAGRAVASGFLVMGRRGRFLATAFHNCSGGISPESRFGRERQPRPLSIEFWHDETQVGRFPTYVGGRSLFRVHPDPEVRRGCDVAVFDCDLLASLADPPLPPEFLDLPGINEHPPGSVHGRVEDMFLPSGRDALVLGFPGGRDFAGGPIAAGCKIAAAPKARMPYLLVSGPTSSGCSGAPVLARDFGGYLALGPSGPRPARPDLAVVDQWLGLYSGRLRRLHDDGTRAALTQIGVVWTCGLVLDVGNEGVPDFFF